MIFWDILRSAVRSLIANRLRTFLTMLGVVIGVGSVLAMIALGEGARKSVEDSIKSMGTNLLWVRPGADQHGPVRGGAVETLLLEDADAILGISNVVAIAPEVSKNAQAKYLSNNFNTGIVGTTHSYMSVRSFEINEGDFISERDVMARRRVAVLGAEAATELFADAPPVGERIQIKGISFEVIGVLKAKGEAGWSNPDQQIIVPISVAQKNLFGMKYVTNIGVQLDDEKNMEETQKEIKELLRTRHRLREDAESDFNVRSQTEMLQRMSEVTGTFTALLGGVAAVSLLVGGIGIMNIMLVSVRERTKEIGIRKAVGAKDKDILTQFLIEATVVSVIGGMLGIGMGYGIAILISKLANWVTIVPLYSIVLAVGTSAGIGLIFGVWPARIASKLDPVEALRYE
ncbi:TPA: hypothetical protein DEF17_01015 [bacterium]|nr:MAG: hypothetical protein COS94_08480 [Candidatus Hydrogenedentes bacterium CG07_land_8_20_14_0_80_42_17]HBW46496.1 hypothetical protein [bacterium]